MTSGISVAIIDCGVGNHTSVLNALKLLDVPAEITSDSSIITSATHLILPGVGSFGEGMDGIKERDLLDLMKDQVVNRKKRILGICLGMQLFATQGFEHGEHEGLNFIPGKVEKIDTSKSELRLPHVGWNDVEFVGDHSITKGFDHKPIFYFVHSFHYVPDDKSVIAGVSDYGAEVTALIESENVFGAQFHPEKSHDDGMQIFKNFLEI